MPSMGSSAKSQVLYFRTATIYPPNETCLAYASPRYLASRNRKTCATAESGSGLVEIAVHDFGRVPFALQRAANHLRERHGAVPPARATQCDRKVAFAFPDVMRN